jgi:hypothetical protein
MLAMVLKNAIMSSMNTQYKSKINRLVQIWPKGAVGTQRWLDSQGVSRFLAQQYCRGGWIERLGQGAYRLVRDASDWTGAVYALQAQLNFKVHVGAQTALAFQGYRQYIPQSQGQPIWLIKSKKETRDLPKWFSAGFMSPYNIHSITRALFDDDQLGLDSLDLKDYRLVVSTPERAVLEYLNLVPNHFSLEQAQFLIEGMMTLRPQLLQSLLEHCTSIKTKRLFLVLAEHEGHPWWRDLKPEKIALGHSKLTIGDGGYYYAHYRLSLSINLKAHEGYHDDNNTLP